MPGGKPAGVRCVQLSGDNRCLLFGKPERPEVCVRLRPSEEMCGETAAEAMAYLAFLERATAPACPVPSERNVLYDGLLLQEERTAVFSRGTHPSGPSSNLKGDRVCLKTIRSEEGKRTSTPRMN